MKNKPIKVCFFGKYPPIEGGVSSQAYWVNRAMGKRGVEVHIVTNALEVEEEFREKIDLSDPRERKEYQPENVFVHSLRLGPGLHIPLSPAYLERLINLGLRVIKEYDCDIIDSFYIQPYGIAAAFTKLLTGKPCILRHAGSDIFRLFPDKELQTLYQTVFKIADTIITKRPQKDFFGVPEDKLWFRAFGGVNPEYFNPEIKPADLAELGVPKNMLKKPILTYIGKCGRWKGLFELTKVASGIKDDFLLLFVTDGFRLKELQAYLKKFPLLKNKHHFLGFLPPWKIPPIIRASSCLLQVENNFPIKVHMPSQPFEAFAVGTPLLLSDEIFSKYKMIFPILENDRNVLAVDPKNLQDFKNTLLKIIRNPERMKEIGKRGYQEIFNINPRFFDEAVKTQISLYQKLLKN